MTTIATRSRRIADLEGFDIVVKQNGGAVDPGLNGVLNGYPYDRAAKYSLTVNDWKRDRFEATYPGYTCDVLNGDGSIAAGQTSIRTVRESYED